MKTLKRKQYLLEDEQNTEQQSVVQEIVDKLNNDEITAEEVKDAYENGQISEEDYNEIIQTFQAQLEAEENPQEPQEEIYDEPTETEQIPEPEFEAQPLKNKYNSVKLFDKFVELKKYINVYIKTYNDIETDELTTMQINSLSKFYEEILTLKDNVIFYIDNNFIKEDYKKNLYMYLLFNKEFATQIRKFRHILHLNPNKLIDNQNNKK